MAISWDQKTPNPRSADVADICRLWATLQEMSYGPLSIVLDPGPPEKDQHALFLQVVEAQVAPDGKTPVTHVWAQREYRSNGYSISWGQLFDLLITAYGRMTGAVRDT